MADGMSVDDLVGEFGAHVDAQSAAIFIGAGLSMLSGYPSWSELVQPYIDALGLSEEEARDLPLAVQYFENEKAEGAERVREDIISMVRAYAAAQPTSAHDRILSLPVHDIWTTNYDDLIESAAHSGGIDLGTFREDDDLATSKLTTRRLYKMHGSVDGAGATKRLVISRDHFEHYPETHPRFWQLLRATFLTRSFLFIGFSLTDPNISEIFRMVRLHTPNVHRPHYAVLKRGAPEAGKLAELRYRDLARVGVRIVEIEDHGDVDSVLARLNTRCRPPRLYISGSTEHDGVDVGRTDEIAKAIADELASQPDVLLMTGGTLGGSIGYAVMRQRKAEGGYRPDSLLVIRRAQDSGLGTPPNTRLGSVVFDAEDAEGLRSAAFGQVRAVLVLGGGSRTREEIQQARELGMGVVPVAASGGAAQEDWNAVIANPGAYRLGEQPVDVHLLEDLDSDDPGTVARAAVLLIRQGLSMP